jgi:TolB-like protein/Flp pilus assembly protein TadD
MPLDHQKLKEELPNPRQGGERSSDNCLDSWKAIADFLNRQVRTVQRWEKTEGLPIHRHLHDKAGTVKAYRSEIDAWLRERQVLGKDNADEPESDNPNAETAESGPNEDPETRRRHLLHYAAAFIVGIVVVAGLVRLFWPQIRDVFRPQSARIIILAVKPFQNLGGDAGTEPITQGFTEEMVSRLDLLHPERMGVIKLPATYAEIPPDQIAKKFKADYVLGGTVRMVGQKFAITGQLMQAKDGMHIWGNSYEGDLQDSIEMQNKVATAIAMEVLDNLPHKETLARRVNRDAEIAYLQGRYFWDKRNAESLTKAVAFFEKSIRIDPTYALPYSGLADSYSLLGSVPNSVFPPAEAFPKAEDAARKALKLDESLAEAHVVLGYSNLVYEWNFPEANREFQRALQLQPRYATAHHFYAYYLIAMGQLEKATEESETALQLDPVSPVLSTAVGEMYYQRRLFDLAIERERASLSLDPTYLVALLNMGRAYEQKGMYREARDAFQKILTFVPEDPAVLSLLAHDYGVSGEKDSAMKLLSRLQDISKKRYVPSLYIALVYVGLGEKDQAFRWLDKAYEERCEYLVYLPSEPLGDPLRSDPRYTLFIRRLGLQSVQVSSTAPAQ